jgi:biofilm protein TabA
MNTKSISGLLIAAISLFMMGNNAIAQNKTDDATSLKAAQKWMDSNNWKNGIKLSVHPSTDAAAFYSQYHKNQAAWNKAFAFIKEQNLDSISIGKHPIDGDNVFAIVTEALSKDLDKAGWESHKNYIDLQYVIKGKEQIGVSPIDKATVTRPYDESRDAANYTAEGTYYTAEPGTFFLFFPTDVHRPNIKVQGYDTVKKLVIKIRMAN